MTLDKGKDQDLAEAQRSLELSSASKSDRPLWIMVAGPYRSGSSGPTVWAENLRKLNAAAATIFQKGHVPIIGVNMALPVIEAAGQDFYDEIMLPLSLRLTDRCDGILRIGGESKGADAEVNTFRERGLRVFMSIDEIPNVRFHEA